MALSDKEKQLIRLEMRQARLKTGTAIGALNKAVVIYFIFLVIAVLGFVNNLINNRAMNWLIVIGVIALAIGGITFMTIVVKESKNMDSLLQTARKKLL